MDCWLDRWPFASSTAGCLAGLLLGLFVGSLTGLLASLLHGVVAGLPAGLLAGMLVGVVDRLLVYWIVGLFAGLLVVLPSLLSAGSLALSIARCMLARLPDCWLVCWSCRSWFHWVGLLGLFVALHACWIVLAELLVGMSLESMLNIAHCMTWWLADFLA